MADKKLAFVVGRLPPLGGYRNRLIAQVEFFSKHFDIYLITLFPCELPEIEKHIKKCFSLSPSPLAEKELFFERIFSFVSDARPPFHDPYPISTQRLLIEKYMEQEQIDVVWAFGSLSGTLVKNFQTKSKHLDFCDSNCVISQSTGRTPTTTWLNRIFEKRLANYFDSISYICARDGLAAGFETKDFVVLPNLRAPPPIRRTAKTHDAVILGHWAYGPNQDALLYTANQILPLIKQKISLVVVGPITEELKGALHSHHDITVTGQVTDIFEYLFSSKIMLAPVRYGSGVQQKVLDGLEAGLPILATPFIRTGTDPSKPCPAIIECHSPDEFAVRFLELLRSPGQRKYLGQQGREHAERCTADGRKTHEELRQTIISEHF